MKGVSKVVSNDGRLDLPKPSKEEATVASKRDASDAPNLADLQDVGDAQHAHRDARSNRFFERVEDATSFPSKLAVRTSDGFDGAGRHVVTLLTDAVAAYERGSFGTATFLALTALEETAKAEFMLYRRSTEPKKGRDPLFSHERKYALAVHDTTFMGRLPGVLGAERCEALHEEADGGKLVALREAALYAEYRSDGVVTPENVITQARARELVLLALEAADDSLGGYTNQSMEWCTVLDRMFQSVAESLHD